MELFSIILVLLAATSLSGVITRILPFNLPIPLVQIALGIVLAFLGIDLELQSDLFLVLFIPPLLFADGRNTKLSEFIHYYREIIGLALVLVIITTVGIGYILHYIIPNISLPAAFALAAILSPTDAVALSGIVDKSKINKVNMGILEGESLMNDASGLVAFKFAILVAIGEMEFNLFQVSFAFLFISIGGLVIGIITTWIFSKILSFTDRLTHSEPVSQIILLCLLPFLAYLIAEHCGTSGILAAVSAGMTVNQSGIMRNTPLATRLQSDSTWSMLTFTFNGLVFIMLGLQIPNIMNDTFFEVDRDSSIELWHLYTIVLISYLALMLVRFLWLLSMKRFSLRFLKKRPLAFAKYSLRDLAISTFSGVRGAITLAGILSVPASIHGRYELVFIAAGVIILSLITAVILLPLLLRSKTAVTSKVEQEKETKIAKQSMVEGAIQSLEKMQERLKNNTSNNELDNSIITSTCSRVIASLRHTIEHVEGEEALEYRMRLIAIGAERAVLYQLRAKNEISDETMEKLLSELDIQETVLAK